MSSLADWVLASCFVLFWCLIAIAIAILEEKMSDQPQELKRQDLIERIERKAQEFDQRLAENIPTDQPSRIIGLIWMLSNRNFSEMPTSRLELIAQLMQIRETPDDSSH